MSTCSYFSLSLSFPSPLAFLFFLSSALDARVGVHWDKEATHVLMHVLLLDLAVCRRSFPFSFVRRLPRWSRHRFVHMCSPSSSSFTPPPHALSGQLFFSILTSVSLVTPLISIALRFVSCRVCLCFCSCLRVLVWLRLYLHCWLLPGSCSPVFAPDQDHP